MRPAYRESSQLNLSKISSQDGENSYHDSLTAYLIGELAIQYYLVLVSFLKMPKSKSSTKTARLHFNKEFERSAILAGIGIYGLLLRILLRSLLFSPKMAQSRHWQRESTLLPRRKQKLSLSFLFSYHLIQKASQQAFSQMGIQAHYGRSISKRSCFIFQMLPYKLFICRPYLQHMLDAHFLNSGLNASLSAQIIQTHYYPSSQGIERTREHDLFFSFDL